MIAANISSSTIASTSICSSPRMYHEVSKMLPFQTMTALSRSARAAAIRAGSTE